MDERRVDRSPFKDAALKSWLTAVAHRTGTERIAVSDPLGLVVACGNCDKEAEEMAVTAVRRNEPENEETVIDDRGQPMVIRRMSWKGNPLFVCARGRLESSQAGVAEAVTGIARILQQP